MAASAVQAMAKPSALPLGLMPGVPRGSWLWLPSRMVVAREFSAGHARVFSIFCLY
jgi:hypothetical protein